MKIFSEHYQTFSEQAALSSLILGPVNTVLTGLIVDYFGPKSDMTIPYLCTIKALLNIPFNLMTFFQQKNFWLAMSGVHLEYLISRGWGSTAIFMLKEIVDPSIKSLAISMYVLLISVNSIFSASVMAFFVDLYELEPLTTPKEYGNLVTVFTVAPLILCCPFFMYAGIKVRNMKREKAFFGQENPIEENKKASAFIKSLGPTETGAAFIAEPKKKQGDELRSLKGSVNMKLSIRDPQSNANALTQKAQELKENNNLQEPLMK